MLHGLNFEGQGNSFFLRLQQDALTPDPPGSPISLGIEAVAQRLWTSKEQLQDCGLAHQKEFCSILNEIIRRDNPILIEQVAQLARNINQLCVTRLQHVLVIPPRNVCYRGSSLPDECRSFFEPGRSYRVPGFLATSLSEGVAFGFVHQAVDTGRPAVLWRIRFDPRGPEDFRFRCKHVNLVRHSRAAAEQEYLFAPYSVFTVLAVEWKTGNHYLNPHIIEIEAAPDNLSPLVPEHLPLAPHY